ncbi:phosphatase PAP2 family protein [Lentilactobacillus sp. TOM.63]|uniref:phosphatase PAP2 family protein n=1 Tax=Lentilactobacillus sp. TOM.63 TaxID=3055077 RepID=UPI0025A199A9|nr:phosphatase PAP2 family protein [Lentilactobacillus sp. TOM.63]MDM7517059.1 phosphatase PAP2 family protein [Lentilactobacillus sp. TOM.63]
MKIRSKQIGNPFWGLSLLVFLAFTAGVWRQSAWITQFDHYFGSRIRELANPELTAFFVHFTKIGNLIPLITFVAGACLALLILRKNKASLFLFINTVLLAIPVNTFVKELIDRPRPQFTHLVAVHSSSFPSGHSMSTMMIFGSLIIIVNQLLKNNLEKLMLNTLFIVMIILIGISRIYVGVHFASDVAGGWSLGFCLLYMSEFVFNKFGGGLS